MDISKPLISFILFFLCSNSYCLDENRITGSTLYTQCHSGLATYSDRYLNDSEKLAAFVDLNKCVSYITGAQDGLRIGIAFNAKNPNEKLPYCIPDNVSMKQIIHDLVDYIHNHPEYKEIRGGLIMVKMLIEKYPCKG